MTTHLPGWPLALLRIAFGLLYLDIAFCGAGRIWGLDARLEPALRRRAEGTPAWARLLRYAV